jgi:hypothetical protein
MAAKKLVAEFVKEKETKNKVRFQEQSDEPIIDKLYVSKSNLSDLGDPEELKVTIEVK